MSLTRSLSNNARWLAVNVAVWSLSKQMFVAIKLWGIESTQIRMLDIPSCKLWVTVIVSGMLDGLVFALADRWLDSRTRIAGAQMVALKGAVHVLLALTLSMLILPVIAANGYTVGVQKLIHMMLSSNMLVSLVYIFITTLLLHTSQQVSMWLRHESISEIFKVGAFKEEERIFLFLDMRASTHTAETLGARQYSLLVQDCFRDLSKAVKETNAHIYQYVGDEAVLTWTTSPQNFIKAVLMYFRFAEILNSNSRQYLERFDLVPQFKGGIHYGRVVRAHVGVAHKELAFHGDAINVASRIQGKCSELMRDLLISESVRERLPQAIPCEWEGNYQLRGRASDMNLYSIPQWPGLIQAVPAQAIN